MFQSDDWLVALPSVAIDEASVPDDSSPGKRGHPSIVQLSSMNTSGTATMVNGSAAGSYTTK